MGKKTGAGTGTNSSGKAASNAKDEPSHAHDVESKELTGIFTSDVPVLCNREGIPPISVCNRGSESSSRFTFFVDGEDAEITAVHVRGWLLSDVVATILSEGLANSKNLTGIHLWNVGLTKSTLNTIVQLSTERNIRELSLDANYLPFALPIINLLKIKSLVKLSMKNCGITDQFLADLSLPLKENMTLLHLNLSCNHIGNDGCIALANSLRLNRTLLSLSLIFNSIGDVGAFALAKVLSRFPLNHEEIVLRRQIFSISQTRLEEGIANSGMDLQDRTRESSPYRRSSPSTTTLKSAGKGEKIEKTGNKTKKGEQKKEEKPKKEEKQRRDTKKGKISKEGGRSAKKGLDVTPESPLLESPEVVHPLFDLPVENEEHQLYFPGNTNLVYLTLAYNQIGPAGIHALLKALRIQERYLEFGPGLLRLTLNHNTPSRNCGMELTGSNDLEEIEQFLAKKTTATTTILEEITTT